MTKYIVSKGGIVQSVSKATVDTAMGGLGKLVKLCKDGFTIFEVKGK